MTVASKHDEYDEHINDWEMVEDVCEGQTAVKSGGVKYLPMPNPTDSSAENLARYEQYKARAVYYNMTRRTLQSLSGAAFAKPPTLTIPATLGYVTDDIDGAGISIYQQSQDALSNVLMFGRCGLLADYPRTEAATSVADMGSGRIRATTVVYEPADVINWRTEKIGAEHRLTLVVISECAEVSDDGFAVVKVPQFRALRIINGVYVVELYRKNAKGEWVINDAYVPTDGAGLPWDIIPFTFIGSQSNSNHCDPSPLFDMAVLNLGHYRNSADYEDSVFFSGQPQPWISGLTEEWRDWLQDEGIRIGSRVMLPLPEGGAFGFAQAQPNPLAKEAMDAKEAQMVAIGARLIQPGSATKTATQAQGELEAEHSVLSLIAGNVSEAYTLALSWMSRFMNVEGDAAYTLNVAPGAFNVDGVMLGAVIAANQAGKLPDSDLFRILRRLNVIDPQKTDEQVSDELANSPGLNFGAVQ